MQVKALKTFNGRMGLIRAGIVITVDDRYGKQLIANNLVVAHKPDANEPEQAQLPGPGSNTDLGGAPRTKDGDQGNGEDDDRDGSSDDEGSRDEGTESERDQGSGETDDSRAGRRGGGRGRPLSSQQVGRRSRKKT